MWRRADEAREAAARDTSKRVRASPPARRWTVRRADALDGELAQIFELEVATESAAVVSLR